jgi:arginase
MALELGIVAAPSNLGLRPPVPGAVPGTAKAPEALREAGLHEQLDKLGAREFGVVLPERYVDDADAAVPRLRNQDAIIRHARALADRLDEVRAADRRALVLGGDCSLLVGAGLHLRRSGRYGLVHIDGHTDFRHPGNSPVCHALAGEDLAAAVGVHWPEVSSIDGLAPYFRPADTVHVGCRDDDDHLAEVTGLLADVVPASQVAAQPDQAIDRVRRVVGAPGLDGYWVHLDVDVLDPAVMPAVDSPDPGGLDVDQLTALLRPLTGSMVGLQVCVFDPDLDPDGSLARLLATALVAGLVETPPPEPRT